MDSLVLLMRLCVDLLAPWRNSSISWRIHWVLHGFIDISFGFHLFLQQLIDLHKESIDSLRNSRRASRKWLIYISIHGLRQNSLISSMIHKSAYGIQQFVNLLEHVLASWRNSWNSQQMHWFPMNSLISPIINWFPYAIWLSTLSENHGRNRHKLRIPKAPQSATRWQPLNSTYLDVASCPAHICMWQVTC